MLAAQEDGGSVFMTASKSKKSLHNFSNRHNRASYASLTQNLPGQSQINQIIQDKIDNVLEQPKMKLL